MGPEGTEIKLNGKDYMMRGKNGMAKEEKLQWKRGRWQRNFKKTK